MPICSRFTFLQPSDQSALNFTQNTFFSRSGLFPDYDPSLQSLYLIRPKFGTTLADCISFALSVEYHTTGQFIRSLPISPGISSLAKIAAAVDKKIVLYRHTYMDDMIVGSGVGYIYLWQDLNGDFFIIAWKNEQGKIVLVSDAFTDKAIRPKWVD